MEFGERHFRDQLHQHFMGAFFSDIFLQKRTKLCFGFEIFWRQNIGKKSARKILMKLTLGGIENKTFFISLLIH